MKKEKETKWWYQVINHGTKEQPNLCVHEVHLTIPSKQITTRTVEPRSLKGYETKEEIIEDLEMMLHDLKRENNVILEVKETDEEIERYQKEKGEDWHL